MQFLNDRWTEIVSMTAGQWIPVVVLSFVLAMAANRIFLKKSEKDIERAKRADEAMERLISPQQKQIELYAGQAPQLQGVSRSDHKIVPTNWSPFLDRRSIL